MPQLGTVRKARPERVNYYDLVFNPSYAAYGLKDSTSNTCQ